MSTVFTLVYTQWILVCRVANNEFPYPFLNKMPFPQVCPALTFTCSRLQVFAGLDCKPGLDAKSSVRCRAFLV